LAACVFGLGEAPAFGLDVRYELVEGPEDADVADGGVIEGVEELAAAPALVSGSPADGVEVTWRGAGAGSFSAVVRFHEKGAPVSGSELDCATSPSRALGLAGPSGAARGEDLTSRGPSLFRPGRAFIWTLDGGV
jgi:hypothetical protein